MDVGIVVGFCDPDVLSLSESNALIPLFEWAAGVDLVEFEAYAWIGDRFSQDEAAVVSGAIVQQYQFEVLERLREDRVDAASQEARVIVVRNDNANCGHMKKVQGPESRIESSKPFVLLQGTRSPTFGPVRDDFPRPIRSMH